MLRSVTFYCERKPFPLVCAAVGARALRWALFVVLIREKSVFALHTNK